MTADETVKDGGPAFPEHISPEGYSAHLGMSLRDWFAGQIACGVSTTAAARGIEDVEKLAGDCYRIADALLKARETGAER